MKNIQIFKYSKLFIFVFCILTACQKNEFEDIDSQQKSKSARQKNAALVPNDYQTITLVSGMLKFTDQSHLERVLQQLEAEYEAWNNNFEATYAHLNDTDFNDTAEQTGFNENKTLNDFIALFSPAGFRSLHAIFEKKEYGWMNTGFPEGQSPDMLYEESDEFVRVITNTNGQLMVGNTTHTTPVLSASAKTPDRYKALLCDTRKKSDTKPMPEYDNNTKRYYCFITIRKVLWWGMVKARVKSYYKKNGVGGWKNYRTRLKIQAAGINTNSTCQTNPPFSTGIKEKRRWRTSIGYKVTAETAFAIPGEIQSYNHINGQERNLYLVW